MKIVTTVIAALGLLITASSVSLACVCNLQSPAASLTKEQWRQDLQNLAKELPRRHKNAFHSVTKEQFERAVAEFDAAIPSLQEHEILIGLRRIIALVGDAHTALAPSQTFKRYPLTLYWFGDDLRVVRTTAAYKRALGARVVGIGGLSISEAVSRVNTLVPRKMISSFAIRMSVICPTRTFSTLLRLRRRSAGCNGLLRMPKVSGSH